MMITTLVRMHQRDILYDMIYNRMTFDLRHFQSNHFKNDSTPGARSLFPGLQGL